MWIHVHVGHPHSSLHPPSLAGHMNVSHEEVGGVMGGGKNMYDDYSQVSVWLARLASILLSFPCQCSTSSSCVCTMLALFIYLLFTDFLYMCEP